MNSLTDSVVIVHDNYIGYYKNGFLIATDSISKYSLPLKLDNGNLVDKKDNIIPLIPLISNSFDSLVLKTL